MLVNHVPYCSLVILGIFLVKQCLLLILLTEGILHKSTPNYLWAQCLVSTALTSSIGISKLVITIYSYVMRIAHIGKTQTNYRSLYIILIILDSKLCNLKRQDYTNLNAICIFKLYEICKELKIIPLKSSLKSRRIINFFLRFFFSIKWCGCGENV